MRSSLENLILIAIAWLLRGSHAINTPSGPHSLDIRNSEPIPTCIYTADEAGGSERTGREHHYAITMTLPGEGWRAVCSSSFVEQLWTQVKSRCEAEWTSSGLRRFFLPPPYATPMGNYCQLEFRVQAMPEQEPKFPTFEHPCIWEQKPEFSLCGIREPTLFPWPSRCSVSRWRECLLLALRTRLFSVLQQLTVDF